MAGPSAYVHSNADHVSEWSVNINLINNMTGSTDGELYIDSTVQKLTAIKGQLESAANQFLMGYTTEKCQYIAENAGDLLADLASRVLYGATGAEMVGRLRQNKIVQVDKLRNFLEGQKLPLQQEILNNLRTNMSVSEAATILTSALSDGSAVITVTEAGSHIEKLSGIFDQQTINSTVRGKVVPALTHEIFKTTRPLVTSKNGVYRKAIRDLIESSRFVKTQDLHSSVQSFCDKLGQEMLSIAPEEVPFLIGNQSLKSIIDNFINKLKRALEKNLKDLSESGQMYNKSNVAGAFGEEVRSTIRETADAVIISITMGNLTEDNQANIDMVNRALKQQGAKGQISKMITYHDKNKQSLTDLVLVNTKTGAIARAQSKNHLVSYFLDNQKGNGKGEIENFRWKINDNVNLLHFLSGLSKTELGINLNQADLSTINYAMVNNVWFEYHKSAFPDNSVPYHGKVGLTSVSVPDFQTELEGSLEKLLASQITSLLGVTVATSVKPQVITSGSNIFYLLNGQLKKTSDLIQQAIDQLNDYNNLKLKQDKNRMVIVNIDTKGVASISPGKGENGMLVRKLRSREAEGIGPGASAASIGQEYGEKVLDNIKITVSLGTNIDILTKTSLVL